MRTKRLRAAISEWAHLLKRQLDIILAIGKFSRGYPQPGTEKRSQKMSGARALSVSLMEIHNVENFYREGDDANPDDERDFGLGTQAKNYYKLLRMNKGCTSMTNCDVTPNSPGFST